VTCGRHSRRSGIIDADARCDDCEWEVFSRNSLGLAAQHHDRTGHTVHANSTVGVTYGTPAALAAIQASLTTGNAT
jgi:hypothetical protein